MKVYLALLLLLALCYTALVWSGQPSAAQTALAHFRQWQAKHNINYRSQEEEMYRQGIYERNLQRIAELSQQNPEATFSDNEFADLTEEEFARTHMNLILAQDPTGEVEQDPYIYPANDIDWTTKGAVTDISN